ncbi:MAG: heme ABC exporter ATP-binding protein CcmA [Pseudobacteriovorax sp.]|nr:heme ABC exporter ATP-binding protein CcmA [Pseudobacteriovorax sp.]
MLKVSDLHFGYRFRPILQGVSCEVSAGEILHIVGTNGSGKTTLMSILAGLTKETAGSITLTCDNQEIADRRQKTEYLPAEANGLYGKMDAMDNLRFWQKLRGLSPSNEDIIAALAQWDLDHPLIRSNFPTEKYSTGMKRRLALARVQLSGTPLWLLDEPLYGLDAKGIVQFQSILSQHLDAGGAVAVVSHDTVPLETFRPKVLEIEKRTAS